MITPSEKSDSNGMCPAPLRLDGLDDRLMPKCELSEDHAGDHLAAGRNWKVDPRTGAFILTRTLTRKGPIQ